MGPPAAGSSSSAASRQSSASYHAGPYSNSEIAKAIRKGPPTMSSAVARTESKADLDHFTIQARGWQPTFFSIRIRLRPTSPRSRRPPSRGRSRKHSATHLHGLAERTRSFGFTQDKLRGEFRGRWQSLLCTCSTPLGKPARSSGWTACMSVR